MTPGPPAAALGRFEEATGLRVFAVLDRDGTVWWAKPGAGAPVFECTVGDRVLHIDELAPGVAPDRFGPGRGECPDG